MSVSGLCTRKSSSCHVGESRVLHMLWPPPIIHKQQGIPNKILRPCNGRLSPCPCFLLADSGTQHAAQDCTLDLQVCHPKHPPCLPKPCGKGKGVALLKGHRQHYAANRASSRMRCAKSHRPCAHPHELLLRCLQKAMLLECVCGVTHKQRGHQELSCSGKSRA